MAITPFVEHLRHLMACCGLNRFQLAQRARVSWQVVARLESGARPPDCLTLWGALGIARALGVTVEELFGPYIIDKVHGRPRVSTTEG